MSQSWRHDEAKTNAHGPVGTVREIRKFDDSTPWSIRPLIGWAVHLADGWSFIPAARRSCAMTPARHPTFPACLPIWTGGFEAIESMEIRA